VIASFEPPDAAKTRRVNANAKETNEVDWDHPFVSRDLVPSAEQNAGGSKPGTSCPNATYTTIAFAINAADPRMSLKYARLLHRAATHCKVSHAAWNDTQSAGSDTAYPIAGGGGLSATAVITVINTSGVSIQNFAIDASNNTVTGCTITWLASTF
jgi:hypothetical protein